MNTHFDIATEYGHRRAETLKSLSLETVSAEILPPKPMLRRLAVPIFLSALVVAGGVIFYRPDLAHQLVLAFPGPQRATADPVALAQDERVAERSAARNPIPIAREITGSGFVVALRMTTVYAKYEGRITRIAVAPGDTVEAGQILVTLEDAGARFALELARASKKQSELVLAGRAIDLAQARSLLDRTAILAARDAASMQVLEDARAARDRAVNAVAQARQSSDSAGIAIRIAEEKVEELAVRAPLAGTVTRLDAHVGDTVLARVDSVRESQSLLTITDRESLVIDVDVAETAIGALRPGLRGRAVLDGFPDRPFAVTILRLAPVASAEKGTVALRLSLAGPPDGIRPNMAARISIDLEETGEDTQ